MKAELLKDHEGQAFHVFAILTDEARFLQVSAGHGATAMLGAPDQQFPNIPTPDDVGSLIEVPPSLDIELLLPDPA